MAGIFQDSSRPSTSVPTSPPPPGTQFSRPGSRPTPTSVGIPGGLTNDDIEARIQAAMSTASASGSRSPTNPPRDTRTQLFVGNLPYRVRWQDLKDLFRRAGTVLRADVSLGPDNRSRGYGTVLLASAEDAGRAVDMFNGYVWQTRTLEVRPDRLGVAAGSIGGLGGLGAGVGLGGVGGLGVGTLANLGGLGGVGLAGGLGQLAAGGLDEYGLASLAAGVGGGNIANVSGLLGALGSLRTSTGASTGSGSASPFLEDEFISREGSGTGSREDAGGGGGLGGSLLSANLSAQLGMIGRVASPRVGGIGNGLSSPLVTSPLVAGAGIATPLSPLNTGAMGSGAAVGGVSLNSPLRTHTPLGTSGVGERSRNLFVGNLPFHIQWQDLKDLFRQAGTILRADVALGPDGRSRGFGTVSYSTEMDAERAVRMFNGYEYNGRQLKVHFDKFSASSSTAVPLTGPGSPQSYSAPQSPHVLSYHPPPLSHAASFAQQILMQQQQRQDHLRQEQHRPLDPQQQQYLEQLAAFPLQRSNADSHMFRFHPPEESQSSTSATSEMPRDNLPAPLTRSATDTIQQLLHAQRAQTQSQSQSHSHPSHAHPLRHSHMHNEPEHSGPLHISLPQYGYDFSPSGPGSPYGYELYHMSTNLTEGNVEMERVRMRQSLEAEVMQPGSVFESRRETEGLIPMSVDFATATATTSERPSTSPSPHPPSDRQPRASSHSHSHSESFPSSIQNSQQSSEGASPQVISPASPTQSSSLHAHPAHPGPIALPPPPPVTAFPVPPPHAMSPVYHPQMSPYASPLHHPAVMMSMMGMNMTPHGLPPITPSMPSFTFLPQPSPGVAQPYPSEPQGSNGSNPSPSNNSQGTSSGNNNEAQVQMPASYVAHLHYSHGPMLSPYAPFSPGVAMSPGALWGRPGSGGVNPFINPAVGAPVHQHSGYFPPAPSRPQVAEEPQGYFPPFIPSSSTTTSRPSGLANEIVHDNASASGSSGESVPSRDPNQNSASSVSMGTGFEERRPDSAHSEGTTATGALTGIEASPRPSSNGTSWQTDSADPSPPRDVEKDMQALSIVGDEPKRLDAPIQRSRSTGTRHSASCSIESAPRPARADSDPIQGSTSSGSDTQGEDSVTRVPLGVNGRSISDSVN